MLHTVRRPQALQQVATRLRRTLRAVQAATHDDIVLEGYEATLSAMRRCIDATELGDLVLLRTYKFEGGVSCEALIRSLDAAAQRGVRLRLGADNSPLSVLTAVFEKTTSAAEALALLASQYDNVSLESSRAVADHTKLLFVQSPNPLRCCALMGGVNVGGASGHDDDSRIFSPYLFFPTLRSLSAVARPRNSRARPTRARPAGERPFAARFCARDDIARCPQPVHARASNRALLCRQCAVLILPAVLPASKPHVR